MKHAESTSELFARYAAEVGRHLPLHEREDIEREIVTTLQDRLDDHRSSSGREPAMEDAVEILKETGHPRTTAASYLRHGALVGPELYPLFSLVCRIALPIVAALLIAVTTLSAALGGDPSVGVLERVLRILGSSASAVLQAFAGVVIVFALMERLAPRDRPAEVLEPLGAWDPLGLPPREPADRVKVGEQIAAIVFGTVWIAVLLFLPGITEMAARSRAIATVSLSEGFRRLVAVLVAAAGADVLAATFLLARGRHTGGTTAARALAKVLDIITAGLLLAAWPFLLIGQSTAGTALAVRVLNQVIRIGCILGIVFGAVDLARQLVRWFRGRAGAVRRH